MTGESGYQKLNISGENCFSKSNSYKQNDIFATFSSGVHQTAVLNINDEGIFNVEVVSGFFSLIKKVLALFHYLQYDEPTVDQKAR